MIPRDARPAGGLLVADVAGEPILEGAGRAFEKELLEREVAHPASTLRGTEFCLLHRLGKRTDHGPIQGRGLELLEARALASGDNGRDAWASGPAGLGLEVAQADVIGG
jgi:hypothetical protein